MVIDKATMALETDCIVKFGIKIAIEEEGIIVTEVVTEIIGPITEIIVGPETGIAIETATGTTIDQITEVVIVVKGIVIEVKVMVEIGT